MAWLHAVPKPPAGSRRAEAEQSKPDQRSRLVRMKAAGERIPMPPNPMPHLIARLLEIGLSEPAAMGIGPLSWATIGWWQHNTAVTLSPWEARLMRSLSAAYVTESGVAGCETSPPPWWQRRLRSVRS